MALASTMACGGGGGGVTTPSAPAATPAPVRTVVAQGNFSIAAPDQDFAFFARVAINTTRPGALAITVDWTFPTNRLWMYVAEGSCSGDQFANVDCPGGPTCECRFSVVSEVDSPKPRVLTVNDASPSVRTLFVWNLGPREESCSYEVALTTTAASLAAAAKVTVEPELSPKHVAGRSMERR